MYYHNTVLILQLHNSTTAHTATHIDLAITIGISNSKTTTNLTTNINIFTSPNYSQTLLLIHSQHLSPQLHPSSSQHSLPQLPQLHMNREQHLILLIYSYSLLATSYHVCNPTLSTLSPRMLYCHSNGDYCIVVEDKCRFNSISFI